MRSNKWKAAQRHQENWDRREDGADNKKDEFPSFSGTSKIISAVEFSKGE